MGNTTLKLLDSLALIWQVWLDNLTEEKKRVYRSFRFSYAGFCNYHDFKIEQTVEPS